MLLFVCLKGFSCVCAASCLYYDRQCINCILLSSISYFIYPLHFFHLNYIFQVIGWETVCYLSSQPSAHSHAKLIFCVTKKFCFISQVGSIKREMTFTFQPEDLKRDSSKKMSHQHLFPLAMEEDVKTTDTKKASRAIDHEKENTRSICLLEQKRKVVSSNIDVPPSR